LNKETKEKSFEFELKAIETFPQKNRVCDESVG
jgi:hypothetical protein